MQKKTKRGFTLIELLVVIAIIALLLAILMPALGKAKEKAKDIVCKTHLKGIGLAVKLYLTEYDDRTPVQYGEFYRWIDPDTDAVYEQNKNGIDYRSYWGVCFKDYAEDKKIFSCPSFAQYRLDMESGYIEYVMDDTKIQGGYGINEYSKGIKVGTVRSPSEYIITQDHVEPQPDRGQGDFFFRGLDPTMNVPQYRNSGKYATKYRGLFRHSKKNAALDKSGDQARFDNIDANPNGRSNTLRLDGSVDAMNETTGIYVKETWYTGGIIKAKDMYTD